MHDELPVKCGCHLTAHALDNRDRFVAHGTAHTGRSATPVGRYR